MPRIEFDYDALHKIFTFFLMGSVREVTDADSNPLLSDLPKTLVTGFRAGVAKVKPDRSPNDYEIEVRGKEQPKKLKYGLRALNIIIWYDIEWGFTEEDRQTILDTMIEHLVTELFTKQNRPVIEDTIKIKMYALTGRASATV